MWGSANDSQCSDDGGVLASHSGCIWDTKHEEKFFDVFAVLAREVCDRNELQRRKKQAAGVIMSHIHV